VIPAASRLKASVTTCTLGASPKHGSQDAAHAEQWRDTLIAVVADGVGTAAEGREAATRVVESLVANFKSRPATWTIPKALEEFTRLANRTLHQESLARFERPELLSTVAVVAIEGTMLHGLNVGDTRVYLWHAGELRCLSEDHCESPKNMRHVLTRAVGMTADIEPHVFSHPVAPGDVLLLCSDGVSNVLDDSALVALLAHRSGARTLVTTAREKATDETLDDMAAVVVLLAELSDARMQELDIPDQLVAGASYDGFTLVRPFNPNERTWVATRDGQKHVLKFAPRQARHSEAVRNQFAREIWSLTRLQADFFIRAFVPENGRTFCYAMEFVEAPTLKEFLKANGPLAVDEAVALARFLLDAGQHLLRFDLAHGDIKPENILVLKSDGALRFKLIDFGSISELFSVTTRAGTPSYLAPERFHAAPLNERTEIFAIGVTMFESLLGAFPYGEIEPFQTPAFRPPRRPAQLNPNIPPWIDAVLLRAVAVDPDDRYQNFSEMAFELENPARVKPWVNRAAPLLERNPLLFFKVGFFVLLVVNLVLLARLLTR
jgi:serine/threonine protein kinase